MSIPKQEHTVKEHHEERMEQSASFKKTYDSIEALFGSKIARLIASKNLVVAEAKLSLSAILLSFAISLTLVVIAAVIWILLNIGLGLVVYKFIDSISLSIILLLVVNTSLGLWLFKQLKSIWKLVGFHSTVAQIVEGN
ncbi:hypothetical protein [Colwellia sp. UCD-KL20]|uniref:hypothetical protein n=1 Tax=Colwellia sp. UCD-KL20 TaxID=1917165 RepID=UPI000970A99E|nr:hypothetical protein [Colwellia sp. UCD-KL20]